MERKNFEVKPMRLYELTTSVAGLKKGDLVVGEMLSYYKGTATIKLAGTEAKMRVEDNNLCNSYEGNEKELISLIGKKVLARVKENADADTIILERNTICRDTIEILKGKVGKVVSATIENFAHFGAFVDIGNGIMSLLHISEVSKARYSNISNIFKRGQEIKVRIMDIDPETYRFHISRKSAYTARRELESGMCVKVIASIAIEDRTGLYVEFDPVTTGIMDIPKHMSPLDFEEGNVLQVMIDRDTEKGFHCNFFGFV